MSSSARPVKVSPRLDAKPWGGRRLEAWGIVLPPGEAIGEALLTAPEATVAVGPLAGTPLAELARTDPEAWIGANGLRATGGRHVFPLLVKLIDGQADLSVQVHPDDRAAAAAGLGTGKTEAYHVLAADPGSVIYLGLKPDAEFDAFATACRRADGAAARFLRRVPAVPGMTVLIPAGTLHALGAGIILYEIQQPSNVTFRLDDWGRVDAAGCARPLHHDAGFAVVTAQSRPEPIPPVDVIEGNGDRTLLVTTPYFALERVAPAPNQAIRLEAVASPQVLTGNGGTALLDVAGWVSTMAAGDTIVVPARRAATLAGREQGVVLRGWVPDI